MRIEATVARPGNPAEHRTGAAPNRARRLLPAIAFVAVLGVLCWGLPPRAFAETYPSKPIRIIVPYPPGGFNDTLARTLGRKFTDAWHQPAIVENRPGGGTTIGTALAAQAPPDGHTLLIVSFAFAVNPSLYPRLPYDSLRDLAPVAQAATTPNLLVVNPAVTAKTLKELMDLARQQPGRLNYASAGNGSSNHLSMELFKRMTSLKLVHVPYKGSAPAVTDLIGGQVDAMFDNVPNVIQQVKAGRLRALAVSSSARSPLVPEVPTVAEAGVPGFDVSVWFGVMAPAGTPAPVVARLNAEINRILKMPDVIKLFNQQGVQPHGGSPREFDAMIRAQMKKWEAVVRSAGVVAD
jgi:tripartite-type tricarboxylate transporter receptor subunit TctC